MCKCKLFIQRVIRGSIVRGGGMWQKKIRNQWKLCYQSLSYCGKLELTYAGDSGKHCGTFFRVMHLKDERVAVFILSLHQCLRAAPGGVDSQAFLVCFTGGHNRLWETRESPQAKDLGAGLWKEALDTEMVKAERESEHGTNRIYCCHHDFITTFIPNLHLYFIIL